MAFSVKEGYTKIPCGEPLWPFCAEMAERKTDGTETRPLASILPVIVDMNMVMPASLLKMAPTTAFCGRTQLKITWFRMGYFGITWEYMGVNGKRILKYG
jgi:hypothetical protein